MKKYPLIWKGLAVGIISIFVCGAFIPACSAQTNILQINGVNTTQELSVKKVKHTNNDNEDFFDFAIIWGTFENKSYASFVRQVFVNNPGPWYNRTMNVIAYNFDTHQWFHKTASIVECNFIHIGPVGKNWLFIVAYGNIAAW
jgi:hypothetical protein